MVKFGFILCFFLLSACYADKKDALSENINFETLKTRSDWRNVIQWPQSCEDGVAHLTKYSDAFVGVEHYKWSGQRRLVSVVCETAAYNQSEMIFIESAADTGKFTVLGFPQFGLLEDAPASLKVEPKSSGPYYKINKAQLWGNLKVDSDKYRITNDNFFRGGGGCGISVTYSLIKDVPEIEKVYIKKDCDANNPDIKEWPKFEKTEFSLWPQAK